MLVSEVGSGRLLPEKLREKIANGEPKVTRLDDAVRKIVSDEGLASDLAQGLASLLVEGVSLDDLLTQ